MSMKPPRTMKPQDRIGEIERTRALLIPLARDLLTPENLARDIVTALDTTAKELYLPTQAERQARQIEVHNEMLATMKDLAKPRPKRRRKSKGKEKEKVNAGAKNATVVQPSSGEANLQTDSHETA